MKTSLLAFCLSATALCVAQEQTTTAAEVSVGLAQQQQLKTTSIVKNSIFKNIGPTVMSGRVVDVAVNPDQPSEFYVGYASGGLWHTANNGTTFTPILDNTQTQNVGEIAVHWPSGTIWVGTGENNASRSSYAGIGILKSTDKGKTWTNVGLPDSHHIGRIHINPNNPNEVVLGATGHLYTTNKERGVYKTTDGGKTWKNTLFISEKTGVIDLAVAPDNFNIQFAASWEKDRKAWDFIGNGNESAIYKSTDAGSTWAKVSTPKSGFPTGNGVGRIGLAMYDSNTIYAVHDSQFRRENEKGKKDSNDGLTKNEFKTMSVKSFLALEDKKLNAFLKTNGFQEKYRAENVKQMVRSGAAKPEDVAKYLEDANAMLFDTPVVGAEVYRSDNGGATWIKQNENYIDDLFYSYGYYFAQIRVHPTNKNKIYLAGVPLITSDDGGKTYRSISAENVHSDHHALWINPNLKGHIINGNDGGINISYDDGENWIKNNSPAVGQFYAINVDNEEPYNVYGGLQDNGVWKGANNAREDKSWHQSGQYPWKSIMGGDGMQIQIDNRNSNIVFTGFQFGNYYRLDLEKGKQAYIQPKHELGETPYRFNWQTPILLSSHNQDILYLGGNKLHRSLNQGDSWETISGDLTQGAKAGNVAFGTLTTISESAFKFGHIYTGSDDGLVQMTTNGGGSWSTISTALPQHLWVSRVAASKHHKNRVYVTLNGYRSDNFTPYVYRSDDMGANWVNIGKTLPTAAVNVITEDPENENLLFVGTDNGAYASFDMGATWQAFDNIPNVAVHDIVIQPKAKELLLGTHGRSIYKTSIAHLQALTPAVLAEKLHVFPVKNIRHSSRWGSSWSSFGTPQTPGISIDFYTNTASNCTVQIESANGILVNEFTAQAVKGLNSIDYDVTFSKTGKAAHLKKQKQELPEAKDGKTYLTKGMYTIKISANGIAKEIPFELK